MEALLITSRAHCTHGLTDTSNPGIWSHPIPSSSGVLASQFGMIHAIITLDFVTVQSFVVDWVMQSASGTAVHASQLPCLEPVI